MKTLTRSEIVRVWLDTPLNAPTIKPKSPSDFGGPDSVQLKVMRLGKNFNERGDGDFGVYLGYHKGLGYVVLLQVVLTYLPRGGEAFESISKLKEFWELD